jgi:hypothetical protein
VCSILLERAPNGDHSGSKVFIGNENNLLNHFIMNENFWEFRWSADQIKALLGRKRRLLFNISAALYNSEQQ